MILNQADRQSPTWLKVVEHLTARLDILRRQNDGNLSADETMKLRGRISEVKAMLNFGKELPEPEEP